MITLWAFAFFGCDNDSITDGDGTNVIMPLGVGYEWIGTMTLYDWHGSVTNTSSWTFYLAKDTTINNEQWFIMQHINDDDTLISNMMHANRSDGLWVWYTCKDSLIDQPRMWSKYPAAVGDTFISGKHPEATVTVIATDTTISVPRGDYSCYGYRWVPHIAFGDVDYYYLTLNLGLTGWETYRAGPDDAPYLYRRWVLEDLFLN